jgi:two-component system response regulator RegX3
MPAREKSGTEMLGTRPAGAAPRIAVLEDDPSQAKLLQTWLESQGLVCRVFSEGGEILRAVLRDTYDLVILDWRVPDLSGEEVLRAIRKSVREPVPVLFATAQDREEDIVHALKAGADDYLTKPLRRLEFMARVEALLRRARAFGADGEAVEAGAFRIDPHGRTLYRDEAPIELTQKEFDMALLFFRNVGRLLSRAYLLDTVWGVSAEVSTRTVDTHASQLRVKLGLYPESGWRLSAVYHHGYRLERLSAPRAVKGTPAGGKQRKKKVKT